MNRSCGLACLSIAWFCLAVAGGIVHAQDAPHQHVHMAPADDAHDMLGEVDDGAGSAGTGRLQMADEENFGALLVNRFEAGQSSYGNSLSYDLLAWFGRDYDRLVVKAEGDSFQGRSADLRTEALWGHAIAPFWDLQWGLRNDAGSGPQRQWMAVGVQGLAPYWFDVEFTAYVGDAGRTALRLSTSYDLLLTQRLILQPQIEADAYGQDDTPNGLGAGLSSTALGLRLRYELRRELAPYVGVEWRALYGTSAGLARDAGTPVNEMRWVAGLRFWF